MKIEELLTEAVRNARTLDVRGRVHKVIGTMVYAVVPGVDIGELCILYNPHTASSLEAEVVGFDGDRALLTPLGAMTDISTSVEVIPTGDSLKVAVGEGLLGRVLDGMGRIIDGGETFEPEAYYSVYNEAPLPLERRLITEPISMGIKALDGLLTCAEGQRLGIFAAAGVGKSTLLSMLVRNADVDVTVLALVGERGREVREFIEKDLGDAAAKAVVVASTSDRSSMERAKAAFVATAVAEYFRDRNKRVLLLMDSVTRFARAQREIGLAAGEPPTRRGFPPSVFAALPRLMERSGMSAKGSITAFYTVLVEGDDMTEPVADETRSILDGHIILNRELAAEGHYPAINTLESVSRVMGEVVSEEHIAAARRIRQIQSRCKEVELLVRIGEYKKGADPQTDDALARRDAVNRFLCQRTDEKVEFGETLELMQKVIR